VYALLFCFPFTKLRHFVIAPVDLFFRNLNVRGRLAPIKDFENAETFGVSHIEQYSWKQLLDMASCLECGRCTINCPTVNTGKVLNPKFLVIEQREHLLDKAPSLLTTRALSAANAANGRANAHNGAGHADDAAHGAETAAGEAANGAAPEYSGPDMITEVATEQQPSGRPDGVAGQSLPPLKVHTKAIQALSRADGRWYFLPVVELPVILTPGEDGYIVGECPEAPDFSGFPITW
jgi:ferredoxin